MPPGGSRNDPLAGWGRENLADPRRRQGHAQNIQATQYDDDDVSRSVHSPPPAGGRPSRGRPPSRMKSEYRTPSPSPGPNSYSPRRPPPQQQFAQCTPSRGRPPSRMRSEYRTPSPSRGPPTRGRPPSHMRSEYRTPSSSPISRTAYRSRSRGMRPQHSSATPPRRLKRVFTEEEKASCPFGDTRWPPKGEYLRPLHFRYEVSGSKKRIYYNMIYQNTAFEATQWLIAMEATAAKAASNIPGEEAPQITIMNAFNSKKLRVISEGKRGKIWILDEGCEGIWPRMASMTEERGAVRVSVGWETFAVFGVGLKGNKGDVLLISWDFPAEQVRMPG